MPAAICVRSLSISVSDGQKRTLLDDISFDVAPGQFVAVVGPSGCGKSTLIRALAGQITPSLGSISFAGHPVSQLLESLPLAVAYLPQFGAFHPEEQVDESLQNALRLRLPLSVPKERKTAWRDHIVDLAGLGPFITQRYRTLSGGQLRRAALAEQLIGDPAFLLLDELTSGLDPHSDREMMHWLASLAHQMNKTIVLVTHASENLHVCDSVLFLNEGKLIFHGRQADLLTRHQCANVADLFELYQGGSSIPATPAQIAGEDSEAVGDIAIKSLPPPAGWQQLPTLLRRQLTLLLRDRSQLVLQAVLIITFPLLVAVFALGGLPQVRNQALDLQTSIVRTMHDQLAFMGDSFKTASLISGLTMFQVVLLALMGANNGAREIAKERDILSKDLRAGLSPGAYVLTKHLQVALFSVIQAAVMACVVKNLCGFPGSLGEQFLILFLSTFAISSTCLAISASSHSAERASLLSIYLVGFQLPLSGAALALPDWLSTLCRPIIAAYWGWSGYLQTLNGTRYFEIVRQAKDTWIATFSSSLLVLTIHVVVAYFLTTHFTSNIRSQR